LPRKKSPVRKAAAAGALPALQQRSRDKRDRLIRSGMATFARKGYEQARVADIAEDAGISVGVFYQRFKDKRGFFDALESDFLARGRDNWDTFFERADPAWSAHELLERLVAGAAQTMTRHIGFFRALITLGHHDKSVVHPAVELDLYGARKLEEYLIARKLVGRRGFAANQVYFGIAAVMKTLLVMACNDVGPYRATDRRTFEELARMLGGYLGLRMR
jgi:AcrR family transcriptional regulator